MTVTTTAPATRNRIHFGVFFQGVNFSTIWHWPESGDQIAFESFRRIAQTAERGIFAALFLGEGLRLREHLGEIHDLDIVGRPDAQTQEAAVAAITERLGLVATQNTTYNDPADLAYRLASLNRLSGGRNGWNIVTTHNAWTGENFRRGGYVADADRYRHADAFVSAVKAIWRAGDPARASELPLRYRDDVYDLEVARTVPLVPDGRPVLIQAGDSGEGRDFGAKHADLIFTGHAGFEAASEFAADIERRALLAGRRPGSVLPFPGANFVIGDTDAEAQEKWREIQVAQVTPQTALAYLEQFWGTRLDAYDPDGPLPDIDPVVRVSDVTRGAGFQNADAKRTADEWRAQAAENGWSIREFVIRKAASRGEGNGSSAACRPSPTRSSATPTRATWADSTSRRT
nr:LLM class flavin-dependent oxidoreductase [Pseudoclavibacter chungangensis]